MDGVRCPKCEFDILKRGIKERGLEAVTRPKPMPGHKFGTDLFAVRPGKVLGEWIRWFSVLPLQCTCQSMRPLINRDFE